MPLIQIKYIIFNYNYLLFLILISMTELEFAKRLDQKDFRYPNIIRLVTIAFYTSFEDVYKTVERIIKIMENKEYEKYENNRGIVA